MALFNLNLDPGLKNGALHMTVVRRHMVRIFCIAQKDFFPKEGGSVSVDIRVLSLSLTHTPANGSIAKPPRANVVALQRGGTPKRSRRKGVTSEISGGHQLVRGRVGGPA